jgi:hypothetical protein
VRGGDQREELGTRDHLLARPPGRTAHVHVLDEADLRAELPGEGEEVEHLVLVRPAHHHRVQLQREALGARRLDAGEHAGVMVGTGEGKEALGPQRVQADGEPPEPGLVKLARTLGQEHSVGGHREVAHGGASGERPHQGGDLRAEKRLSTRQTDLVDPQRAEDAGDAVQLLEGEQVLLRQPDVLRLGHAVAAAQVAPVGDAQPQAPQRTAERVADEIVGCLRGVDEHGRAEA